MAASQRRKSVAVKVGGVSVGGSHPIVVQSMTNTDTADSVATVNQVMQLARAGSELVRVTVNTDEAAQAVPVIVDTFAKLRCKRADHWRLSLQRAHPVRRNTRSARGRWPSIASIRGT